MVVMIAEHVKHTVLFCHQIREPTPDGHRAPVFELLGGSTRSIDTQTPSAYIDDKINEETVAMATGSSNNSSNSSSRSSSSSSSGSNSRSQSASPSFPIIPGHLDSSPSSSRADSADGQEQDKDEAKEEDKEVEKTEKLKVLDIGKHMWTFSSASFSFNTE